MVIFNIATLPLISLHNRLEILRINNQKDASSIQNFILSLHVSWQNKILDTWCILLVIYTKIITMHGHLNVKVRNCLFVCWFVCLVLQPIVVVFSTGRWGVLPSSFSRFLDHTQRRATFGRTPLDEWPIRHRDLYLTTLNTHRKHPCPGRFEPTISAGERPKTYASDRTATGTGNMLETQVTSKKSHLWIVPKQ